MSNMEYISLNDYCKREFGVRWHYLDTDEVPSIYLKLKYTEETYRLDSSNGNLHTLGGKDTYIGCNLTTPYYIIGTRLSVIYLGGE